MKNLKKMYETSSFEDDVFDAEPKNNTILEKDEKDIWDDKDDEYTWTKNEEIEENIDYIWEEEEEENEEE
jgi:hypothetical protein